MAWRTTANLQRPASSGLIVNCCSKCSSGECYTALVINHPASEPSGTLGFRPYSSVGVLRWISLLDASLMRPRYLIRLFETARRRAVTLGREKIDEADYKTGVEELGWQVMEDFDRELADIVPDAKDLLFELALLDERTSLSNLRQVIQKKVNKES